MKIHVSLAKPALFAFVSTCSLLFPVKPALAQWTIVVTELSANGPPDVTISTTGSGTASADGKRISTTTGTPPKIVCGANPVVSANSPTTTGNLASGHAFVKRKFTATWSGTGTPTTFALKFQKTWNITPLYPGSTQVNLNCVGSFDGTSVTTATGQTPWTTGWTSNTSGATFTFSAGANAGAGYGRGNSSTSSNCSYLWDMTNITP